MSKLVLALCVGPLAMSTAYADGEPVILIASQPGGKLALQPLQKGAARDVPDGASGMRDYDAKAPEGSVGVKIDNVFYAVKLANVCVASGEPRADGARFIACNESSGDFPHADLWYVPTFAKRIKVTDGGSDQQGFFGPSATAPIVVVADEKSYVIDPATAKITPIENAGSPSWSSDGVLYYRTLDGGAWKLDAGKPVKLGKGKKGKSSSGDLNSGIEPTKWPAPVTFDKAGKPTWK